MTDRDAFLAWVKSALHDAEVAVHGGDAAPRRAIWSRNEPVTILGAFAQRVWAARSGRGIHCPRDEFLRLHVI